ncbi:MAG: hypothetical protein KC505_02670 [Myxococcales bacterium]|nr:hypothetical protein [Myxococcales bacterium]
MHREHEVDLKRATELYMDDAFNIQNTKATGKRGVKVVVTNGTLGVGVNIAISYDS